MCVIETSPVIETRRLLLRAPAPQDVPAIARMANDHDIARMTKRMPHPFGQGDAEDFVIAVAAQNPARANTFLIEHEDHGPVGVLGMFEDEDRVPETGYWIGREFWGRGLATEALEGALVWASRRWKRRARSGWDRRPRRRRQRRRRWPRPRPPRRRAPCAPVYGACRLCGRCG